jgi:hypothetical protein
MCIYITTFTIRIQDCSVATKSLMLTLYCHTLFPDLTSAKQWFVLHHCSFVIMCYTNGTTLWDWFGSFNKMPWQSIYVVLLSSYCWDNSFYINSWFNHRKHLDWFQFCNIIKKTQLWILHISFCVTEAFISLEHISKSIIGLMVSICLTVQEIIHFQNIGTILHSPSSRQEV